MDLFVPSYLKHTYLFHLATQVASKKDDLIQLNDTIFHPQGGGQPNDKGWVSFVKDGQLVKKDILAATSDRESGKIFYKISSPQTLNIGDKLTIQIDPQVRAKHAKLHSAGHMIDLAVQRLKYQWQTAKGYHFQDSPFVQYKGKLQNTETVATQIQKQIDQIISQAIPSVKQVFSYQQAVAKGLIPQTFKTPLVRVVHFDTSHCPCGGTHVQNTNEYKSLKITKVQKKGKSIKVYYAVE